MSVKINALVSKSVGPLTRWQKEPNGISGQTGDEKFRAIFYTDEIVRITLTKEEHFEDFSYAVVATPGGVIIKIEESPDEIKDTSATIILSIKRNPLRFRFYNLAGEVIHEDDEGFGTAWNGEQV